MNIKALLPVAAVLATVVTFGVYTHAQQSPFKRTMLQKNDLSISGREVIQALAEIPAGVRTGRHIHPGEELGYVLEGTLLLEVEGKPPLRLKAGDVFFVEAGRPHDGSNEGPGSTKVLATYVVEKGKPLASPVP